MEPEGISKFWKTKAWAKMTRISRVQMEARDSSGVSVWGAAGEDGVARASAGVVSVGVVGVVNGISRSSSVYRLFGRGGIWRAGGRAGLVDDAEGAVPAGEVGEMEEGVERAGLGGTGGKGGGEAGRGGLVGGRTRRVVGFAEGEVDEQGAADDGGGGDEAPVAAVLAVVAVVAEDEVLAGGDGELAAVDELLHLDPPVGVDVGIGVLEAGEVVAEVVGGAGLVAGVGLEEGLAVDEDAAVAQAEVVAGEADDALDQVHGGVDGVVEDDDVAAVEGGGGRRGAGSWEGKFCLVTRRKSPTSRVGSMEAEGMRKGWARKVMMKTATMMM